MPFTTGTSVESIRADEETIQLVLSTEIRYPALPFIPGEMGKSFACNAVESMSS